MRRLTLAIATAVLLAPAWAPSGANGAVALIINGALGTTEPETTAAITANLNDLLTAAGFATTIRDDVPVTLDDLVGYDQVWDVRFSNNQPLTDGDRGLYLSYLQSGGGMFVMGENQDFAIRNASVLDFINNTGAGLLGFTEPADTQTVLAPFTGPNAVTEITFAAPGGVGVDAPGTGQFITVDANGAGTGLAFGAGAMPNAPTGTLAVVFDVNFMENNPDFDAAHAQPLLKNLIGFIDRETNTNVPAPATVVVWSILGLMGLIYCRRFRS